jgi:hypothetical protein
MPKVSKLKISFSAIRRSSIPLPWRAECITLGSLANMVTPQGWASAFLKFRVDCRPSVSYILPIIDRVYTSAEHGERRMGPQWTAWVQPLRVPPSTDPLRNGHPTGLIAATLGVDPAGIAVIRQQLIDRGMVWSQRYGETAFTVPLFDEFMKRQMPDLIKHKPKRRKKAGKKKSRKKRKKK